MKNVFFSVLVIIVLIAACDKNEKDYRDQYTGHYAFEIHDIHSYFIGIDSTIHLGLIDTTYIYYGSIKKIYASDNEILVDWGDDIIANIGGVEYTQKSHFAVDTNGTIYIPGMGSDSPRGYINSDTIKFDLCIHGGLAGALYNCWNVVGLKEE